MGSGIGVGCAKYESDSAAEDPSAGSGQALRGAEEERKVGKCVMGNRVIGEGSIGKLARSLSAFVYFEIIWRMCQCESWLGVR